MPINQVLLEDRSARHTVSISVPGAFSLRDTLTCGQCFRWTQHPDGSFLGAASGRVCGAYQDGSSLTLEMDSPEDLPFWREYFDLDRDYDALAREFSADKTLAAAVRFAPGIRILAQDPWEALISFIISQNNRIERISAVIGRLCEVFGEPLPGGLFSFPEPEILATQTEESLAPLRCGYRTSYLLDAARRTADGRLDLAAVSRADTDTARSMLLEVRGVGPKVAECVLLYGFGRLECFPVDTWIRRVMREYYPGGLPDCALRYAGIAQQFLFHYIRNAGKQP